MFLIGPPFYVLNTETVFSGEVALSSGEFQEVEGESESERRRARFVEDPREFNYLIFLVLLQKYLEIPVNLHRFTCRNTCITRKYQSICTKLLRRNRKNRYY